MGRTTNFVCFLNIEIHPPRLVEASVKAVARSFSKFMAPFGVLFVLGREMCWQMLGFFQVF